MREDQIADFICQIKSKLGCGVTFNLQLHYKALFDQYFINHNFEDINKIILSQMKIEAFKTYVEEKIINKQHDIKRFYAAHTIPTCIGTPTVKENENTISSFIIKMMREINASTIEFFLLINYHLCYALKSKQKMNGETIEKSIVNAFFNYLEYLHK